MIGFVTTADPLEVAPIGASTGQPAIALADVTTPSVGERVLCQLEQDGRLYVLGVIPDDDES